MDSLDISKLKEIIKEAVREVLHEEFLNLWINSLPYVSDEEMKDIQERYGSPNYTEDEFVEGDEWLGRRSSEKKS
ncbi:MAG: hypothetical protein ACO2PO_00390 [Candidatus Calescibacterium sp.]|jgi:HKD family nuclease